MAKRVTVDASVALSWVLPGEASPAGLDLRARAADEPELVLLVPPTFWYEVSNALWVAVRRHRLTPQGAALALDALVDFQFETRVPDPSVCLRRSIELNVPVYDSAYLQLAFETESDLWTVDQLLAQAASSLSIPLAPV